MLLHSKVNPLNVHGLRRLAHCPPHFTVVNFDNRAGEKRIADWVYENLEGRFWLGNQYVREPSTGETKIKNGIGFELPAEASYFLLLLDQINKDRFSIDIL